MKSHDSNLTLERPAVERHFTCKEVAELWNLSDDAIRRMFEREPGVLVLGGRGKRRRYRTLRIPESVLQRVHRRHLNVAA